jgi:hypothetical protein
MSIANQQTQTLLQAFGGLRVVTAVQIQLRGLKRQTACAVWVFARYREVSELTKEVSGFGVFASVQQRVRPSHLL